MSALSPCRECTRTKYGVTTPLHGSDCKPRLDHLHQLKQVSFSRRVRSMSGRLLIIPSGLEEGEPDCYSLTVVGPFVKRLVYRHVRRYKSRYDYCRYCCVRSIWSGSKSHAVDQDPMAEFTGWPFCRDHQWRRPDLWQKKTRDASCGLTPPPKR